MFPARAEQRQLGWTDLKSIRMVYRERTVNGKTSQELIYFISSLEPKVRALAKHVRDHWKTENPSVTFVIAARHGHWSLDVTFAEDTSRIRKGDGAANAAIFRRLALTILKRYDGEKLSLRAKRLTASWSSDDLLRYHTGNQA